MIEKQNKSTDSDTAVVDNDKNKEKHTEAIKSHSINNFIKLLEPLIA
jgi:hypothetical protein